MTRPSTSPGTGAAIAFLAAGTTFFTLLTWDGLSDDSSAYLVPLFWLCVIVAAVGFGLRALRTPAVAVVALQATTVALLLHAHWAVGGALGGLVPTPTSLEAIGALMRGAVDDTIQYAAPIPATATSFPALMLASGAGVVLLVDFFACTLRRVPLAGLPLLAAFTAPVSLLGGVSWLAFALAAGCFVLLLAADQASRLGGWGRSLAGPVTDSQPHTVGLSTVWPTATRIGVAGIGLAVLAPALLPTTSGLLGGEGGIGAGTGDDEVNIENPMLDVRRDLRRGEDVELLRATTDDPDPRYLRISVLDEFTGASWMPSDREIPATNQVTGEMPAAPGLESATDRTEHDWSISVTDELDSIWLPIPYPATDVQVNGDWRYDERTLDLMTPVEDATTAGLTYTAVGQEVGVDPATLVAAPPPNRAVFIEGTELPESVPSWLEDLSRDVTDSARSDFERAVQLQEWFRVDGGFTYSVEDAQDGNGTDELRQFLLGSDEDSRTGYCEQFSAAMALMARSIGIPARVAVGFLRPEKAGDEWVYSTHDLHSWPELYFEGAGWLRFEPTPAEEDVAAPDYTAGRVPAPDEVDTPTASPTAEQPSAAPTPDRALESTTTEDEGPGLLRWVGWTVLALAVVGLLLLPRGLRALLRRRRLSPDAPGGAAEGAWAEVRATALDLGLGWDDGVTLRRRARGLVPAMAPPGHGVDQPAMDDRSPTEALETLVLRLERSRFSRTGLPEDTNAELPGLAVTVTEAMRRAAKPRAQKRAIWLPASLWRGEQGVAGRRGGPGADDRVGELDRVSV